MSIGSLLGFVSLVGWIMVVGGGAIAISNASRNQSSRPGILLALAGLVIGVLFFIFSSGVVQVEPNEVAVVFQPVTGDPATGRLAATPLGPGFHIIIPVLNIPTIYSTRLQTYTMSGVGTEGQVSGDDSIKARTKDGQQVDLDVSVIYGISPTLANRVHTLWQNRFEAEFVRPTSREAVRAVVSAYGVEEIYGEKRAELKGKIFDALKQKFEENGLALNDVLVRNITFSAEYIKAIEQKQVAQQDAERAKLEADRLRTQAKGQADAAVLAAQGESDALAARAEGEASAIRTRAKADADALGLINEQLSKNPLLLQYTYIQKLASNINMILLPSNSPFLFDPSQLINQAKTNAPTTTPQPTAPAATPSATPAK